MKDIPVEQVLRRLQAENVWWNDPHDIDDNYRALPRRSYFDLLYPLIKESEVRRAILLMGPRRVGKTVLIHHVIQELLRDGVDPLRICYISVDHPIYNNLGLTNLVDRYREASNADASTEQIFVFFDEVQYAKEWEVHLKVLVDTYPNVRFVASGSAAAALRLKSNESGAGRFTDFLLPPLTFYEYLNLLDQSHLVGDMNDADFFETPDIDALNTAFVHYLNFGGYPEVIFSEEIQADPARFIKGDIIDKVLLRDLPSLYGIQDVRELNYLFTTLAYNTAGEISLEQLSQSSGVAKNTIKRYIEYLEAAFLIKVVHRVDRFGKRFLRATFFKVYLTNPSIRSALFAPVDSGDDAMGSLAETGIFSQWFHSDRFPLHYARWANGEVDIVNLQANGKPFWAVEVKWSDKPFEHPAALKGVVDFCRQNALDEVTITTRTKAGVKNVEGIEMTFVPASIYCYTVGRNVITNPRNTRQLPPSRTARTGVRPARLAPHP